MNTDEDPLAVTRTESIEKDLKRSHKKLSRSLSKPKNSRKKPVRSYQTTISQEVLYISPVEEHHVEEKERKAIDYLKELSDIEDAYASNFQEGLNKFCRAQFVEDEMSRAWDMRGRLSRNNSGSPVPILRELQEGLNSDDHQSPMMAPKFSGGSEKRIIKGGSPSPPKTRKIDKGPSYASSGPGMFNKTATAKQEWPSSSDLEALLKRKLIEKMENKDVKENKDNKDNKDMQFTLFEDAAFMYAQRKYAQKTMQKLSKGNPRMSAYGKRSSMTASSSLRATDGFVGKEILMTEMVLQGRAVTSSQQQTTQPQQQPGEKPRVLSNLLRPRSQIERTRTLHALGDVDAVLGEFNKDKDGATKESLQSIVKGALVAKGHTILRSKQTYEDMQNGGEKVVQQDPALVKFWNDIKEIPERGRSNSKTRPGTKEGTRGVSDGREDEKAGKEGTLQLMSSVFPTSWSNKVSSRKFAAGVQGKSVVIIQVPKESRASRKGTHSSEDLDEVLPTKPTRRDSACRDQTPVRSCTQSADVSMLKVDMAKTSYPMGQQQPQLHSLLIKPRAHHSKGNERVTNVGNLRARLITHEDVLSSIGITQPCLISDNPRLLTQETTKSYKRRDYAKRRSRQDAYSIAVSREQSQSTLVMSNMKAKPQMMSLYSWDNYTGMRKESM